MSLVIVEAYFSKVQFAELFYNLMCTGKKVVWEPFYKIGWSERTKWTFSEKNVQPIFESFFALYRFFPGFKNHNLKKFQLVMFIVCNKTNPFFICYILSAFSIFCEFKMINQEFWRILHFKIAVVAQSEFVPRSNFLIRPFFKSVAKLVEYQICVSSLFCKNLKASCAKVYVFIL